MKKYSYPLFSALALFCGAAMLFFTFFTLGWFSDVRGWQFGFEVQINTADGTVTALGDVFWTVAPFGILLSVFLSLFWNKGEKLSAILSTLPLTLYAVCQILLFFGGKETRLPLWITLFFLLTVGIFTIGHAFLPELCGYALLFPLFHFAAETVLFFLSFLLQQKFSTFYFSELLPMGHTSYFRYTFILWSILFYYLLYSLSLIFLQLAKRTRAEYFSQKQNPESEEKDDNNDPPSPEEELAEEDLAEISLEDLGIER